MIQGAFNLRAAGYREPSVESLSYPYKPLPDSGCLGTQEWSNMIAHLSGVLPTLGR